MIRGISILEVRPNERGDLFARLMKDFFLTLGYDDQVRVNVQKSGREVDLEARHRLEPRRAIAECKAEKAPVGGDVVNKFVGALDAEQRLVKKVQTVGYLISLSGFKETAIEQEAQLEQRVFLVNGQQIAEQLVRGHIVVAPPMALERVARLVPKESSDLSPEPLLELLADRDGWFWLVYYAKNGTRNSFALVHADGAVLTKERARQIIGHEPDLDRELHLLRYLGPETENCENPSAEEAKKRYFNYLSSECGEIQLEGLPADQEVGSRHLHLESLFVPLRLIPAPGTRYVHNPVELANAALPVGSILKNDPRIAVLAAPGGGKSTLIKRLAVAYAFPERRHLVADNLPMRDWFPLLVRCRQLGSLTQRPIAEVLQSIADRAEMGTLKDAFMALVDSALRNGQVLLLVDGLDEISEDSDRMQFVSQLRTFLAVYPNTSVVVTSREAGFRVVGGSLASHCRHFVLDEFDDDDIRRLTLAWHREVVGPRDEVRTEALKLVQTICESDRVRRLAMNPLLLTTLLLVKRWVGQLPTRRSVLYGKAIEVLLMTWNVQGHDPLDLDEVIPQLAFVAFQMMSDGVQRISSRRLKELLVLARRQMPELLAFPRLGIAEFVDRVEFRSSLLMLTGFGVEEGTLYPVYEFRHLTFQEYLTAKAIAEGYYPDRGETDTLVAPLQSHLLDDSWKEVVPLVAVLAGRRATGLVQLLIERTSAERERAERAVSRLAQCLLDECQLAPDIAGRAIDIVVRSELGTNWDFIHSFGTGKFGEVIREVVSRSVMECVGDLRNVGRSLGYLTLIDYGYRRLSDMNGPIVQCLLRDSESGDCQRQSAAALAVAVVASHAISASNADFQAVKQLGVIQHLQLLGDRIASLLDTTAAPVQYAVCTAYERLAVARAWSPEGIPSVILKLVSIWKSTDRELVAEAAARALAALPLLPRRSPDLDSLRNDKSFLAFLRGQVEARQDFTKAESFTAALVVGFCLSRPWSDEELLGFLGEVVHRDHVARNLHFMSQVLRGRGGRRRRAKSPEGD